MIDAHRAAELVHASAPHVRALLVPLLAPARAGLSHYARANDLERRAEERLAFRELGLAIGISALGRIEAGVRKIDGPEHDGALAEVEALARHAQRGAAIASFWRGAGPRRTRTWAEHRDIEVMLASCLVPDGVLGWRAVG